MFRIIIAAIALVVVTGGAQAAIGDETCTGTKALCRISLSCPANKCMEDLNLDGVWGCVTCSTPGGSPTDKKENSSPTDGKKKKTR